MKKPGDFARSRARERQRALISRAPGPLVVAVLIFVALTVAGFFIMKATVGTEAGWFAAGVLAASGFWVIRDAVNESSGAAQTLAGAGAEETTASVLKRIPHHHLIHGLFFHEFDVDHVLVGPSGISAVETKWGTREIDASRGEQEQRVSHYLLNARRGARQIGIFLKHTASLDVPVRPVLIVWGPDVADIARGVTQIGDVTVLIGRQHKEWLPLFNNSSLDSWKVDAAREALSAYEGQQQGAP